MSALIVHASLLLQLYSFVTEGQLVLQQLCLWLFAPPSLVPPVFESASAVPWQVSLLVYLNLCSFVSLSVSVPWFFMFADVSSFFLFSLPLHYLLGVFWTCPQFLDALFSWYVCFVFLWNCTPSGFFLIFLNFFKPVCFKFLASGTFLKSWYLTKKAFIFL